MIELTICEIINERNEVTRIDFWNDGKCQVVKSHTYSLMYLLKYQQIQNQYPNENCTQTSIRTQTWIKAYYEDGK